jgi:hypothetical protein
MNATLTQGEYVRVLSNGTKQRSTGVYRRTDDIRAQILSYPIGSAYQVTSVNEVNRAITECLGKLGDMKVDLSVTLAETVKTVDLFADHAADLFGYLLAIKRGRRPRNRFGTTKDLASGYLQYKYGVLPLSMEVKGAYELATEAIQRKGQILSAERYIKQEYNRSIGTLGNWRNVTQDLEVGGSCKLYAEINLPFARQTARIGLRNPLLLGWEIIPYSFVIDWAMPVGNFLEALTATEGLTFVGGYTNVRGKGTIKGDIAIPANSTGTPQSVEYDIFHINRKVLSGFPRPRTYTKSPFTTNNVLSALMLWRNLID